MKIRGPMYQTRDTRRCALSLALSLSPQQHAAGRPAKSVALRAGRAVGVVNPRIVFTV